MEELYSIMRNFLEVEYNQESLVYLRSVIKVLDRTVENMIEK